MSKNFIAILVLVIAGMVGLVAFTGSDEGDDTAAVAAITTPREVQENDYIQGSPDAKAVLIEYGDFGCAGCGALHPLLLQLKEEVGDDLAVVYRHFPLISIHPNAMSAHRASVAAGEQGMFWEMHDLLFERQFEWTASVATQQQAISIIEGYAGELGLDIEQFNADLASDTTFALIDAHQQSGTDLGFTGTPSLILNGEDIATPRSYAELLNVVQLAIDGDLPDSDSEGPVEPLDAEGEAQVLETVGEEPVTTEPEETTVEEPSEDDTEN